MEGQLAREANKRIENVSKGVDGTKLEALAVEGLRVVHAQKGLLRCRFLISNAVSDQRGNWYVGAITTLMDDLAAFATYSSTGLVNATVSLNISYYSTAKIQEEVDIEAKVVAEMGKLTSVVVEVKRTDNGKLIALGRQWMTSIKNQSGQ
ncbi:uncharacterized protein LOC107405021 [Ziziphus jujuba]|uniref:Acyl-coenzyme A thioesterase 13 n=2 Tax=Ziziphus jujuba TaxID=326968 RepID=A0A6P3YYI5_ZIZJJ|nr:uncharacterized protein LOC107405021 [Ziziphus jujuba]KAH7547261.1 hypothetical protein FEM48_Zijuj01G0291100 [Ziziphus jujuba var. spinosa]